MFHEYLHYHLDLVLSISSVLVLIVVITSPNRLYKNFFPIERLENSWRKAPLDSVFVLEDKSGNCTSFMKSSNLISYKWQNLNGCDCSKLPKNKKPKNLDDVYKGHCTSDMINFGCKKIDKSELIDANIWKKVKICYTTINRTNYFSYRKVKEGSKCPPEYSKSCGNFDTLNNRMCVETHKKCPINYLAFFSRYNENILKPDFRNTNSEYGTIFSDVITLDQQPCVNFKEEEDNEINQYILSFNKKKSKCLSYIINKRNEKIVTDTRFTLIDEYSKSEFYYDNGITKNLFHLPNYPDISEKSVKFFAGKYIGWSSDCKILNPSKILLNLNKFIKKSIRSRKIVVAVVLIICLIFICGIILYKYNKLSTFIYIPRENSFVIEIAYSVMFSLFLFIIYIIESLFQFARGSKVAAFMDLVSNQECSDATTNYLLQDFAGKYYKFNLRLYYIRVLCLVSMVPCAIMLCYSAYCRNLTKEMNPLVKVTDQQKKGVNENISGFPKKN